VTEVVSSSLAATLTLRVAEARELDAALVQSEGLLERQEHRWPQPTELAGLGRTKANRKRRLP